MPDRELIKLVRQNEQMKAALIALRRYAESRTFGGWRHYVADICDEGLR